MIPAARAPWGAIAPLILEAVGAYALAVWSWRQLRAWHEDRTESLRAHAARRDALARAVAPRSIR